MITDFQLAMTPIPVPNKTEPKPGEPDAWSAYHSTKTRLLAPGIYYVPILTHDHPLRMEARSSHWLLGYTSLHAHKHFSANFNDSPWHYPYGIAFRFEDIRTWIMNNCPFADPNNTRPICIFAKPGVLPFYGAGTHPIVHPGGITYTGPHGVLRDREEAEKHKTAWMFKIAAIEEHEDPLPAEELSPPDTDTPEHLEHLLLAAHHASNPNQRFGRSIRQGTNISFQGVNVVVGNHPVGVLTSFNPSSKKP